MKTIAVINLKGGVGKTMTTLSLASEFNKRYGKKVLVCDNDPQANATKFFECHDYDQPGMDEIMKGDIRMHDQMDDIIYYTAYNGIDLIPSNLNLEDANAELMTNAVEEQNTRLKNALQLVQDDYDICIIDCPPGIGINVINALCAADDVIVPLKIDKNALDGMEELMEIIEEIRGFNPALQAVRCLVTMYCHDPMIDAGCEVLKRSNYDCFDIKIRYSPKVVGATFWRAFISDYSSNCAAAVDYRRLAKEVMGGECNAKTFGSLEAE